MLPFRSHPNAVAERVSGLMDAYNLSRLSAVVVLFFLGFLSLGWNESPFAYVTLLSAASLVCGGASGRHALA